MQRMGIEVLEATPQRLVATMPVEGNTQPYGLLHGGASVVLAETPGLDRRRPARRARQGRRRPRHQRHPPPGGALGAGHRRGDADQPGPHAGLLRGRRQRRRGPTRVHEPDHLPDPGHRAGRLSGCRDAGRAAHHHGPQPPVRRGQRSVKGWSRRPGRGPLGPCGLSERRTLHRAGRPPPDGPVPPALPRRSAAAALVASAVESATPCPTPEPGSSAGRTAPLGAPATDAAAEVEPPRRGRATPRPSPVSGSAPSTSAVDRAYAPRAAAHRHHHGDPHGSSLVEHHAGDLAAAALHLARRATWGATPALVAEITAVGRHRLARRPAQPARRGARRRDGPAGRDPAGPGWPWRTWEVHDRYYPNSTGDLGYDVLQSLRRAGALVAPPAARGDGRLLDQPPRRHRPLGRGLGQRAPLPPRRHPQVRPRPLRRHARRRREAPRDARPARQRVVDQARPQRELRPRGARAAHRRRRRWLPRVRHPPLGPRARPGCRPRTSPASTSTGRSATTSAR